MKRKKSFTNPAKVRFDLTLLSRLIEIDLRSANRELLQHDWYSEYSERQLEALTKKNINAPGSSQQRRKREALALFDAYEVHCAQVNEEFSLMPSGRSDLLHIALGEAVTIAHDILGPLDLRTFRKCLSMSVPGSGMTYGSSSKQDARIDRKVDSQQTVTRRAVPYIPLLLRENPSFEVFFRQNFKVVRGNRITTVPKTAQIERTIAIEPSVNMMLQRGVDMYMRGRLARSGVDLTDQTRGWPLAARGSVDGSYATIDLSAASDTVTTSVVKAFLPSDWYCLLDDLRSPEYTMDKGQSWKPFNKFSTMGNSTTFPLESLIFYSIARSCVNLCCPGADVVVYGDDILVPREAFLLTMEALQVLGFVPNPTKSFGLGRFRETCGHDYFDGVDIRPIYLMSNPQNECEVYKLYNRLLTNRQGVRFPHALSYLFGLVSNPAIQPRVAGPSEGWQLWTDHWEEQLEAAFMVDSYTASRMRRQSYDPHTQQNGFSVRVWSPVPAKVPLSDHLRMFIGLYTGDGNHVVDSSRIRRRLVKRRFNLWRDFGYYPILGE